MVPLGSVKVKAKKKAIHRTAFFCEEYFFNKLFCHSTSVSETLNTNAQAEVRHAVACVKI